MKNASKLILLMISVLLLAMALCACGGNTDTPATPAQPAGNGGGGGSATAAADAGMVNISLANTPVIDPALGYDEAAIAYFLNIYDSLVFPNHDGGLDPALATSWQSSDDSMVWTFYLRDDVKFHNGDQLTASDVVFSMNRLLALGEGVSYLYGDYVSDVQALDEYTVQFTLSQSFAPFVGSLVNLYIVNEKQIMEHLGSGNFGQYGDYGANWLLNNDAGSGPYKLRELAQNKHVIGDRFDDYWGGFEADAPSGFKILGTTEAVTIRTMMSRHELDITDPYQTVDALKALDAIDGVDVTAFSNASLYYLTLNNMRPPTDDIHVRKAIAYLMDYQMLISELYPHSIPADSVVSSALPGYKGGLFNYSHNLELAEAELKQSKYYGQLSDYPLEIVWNSENVEREQICLYLQAEAQKIGLNVNITQMTWIQVMEAASTAESCPNCFVVMTSPTYAEAGSILAAQYTTHAVGSWETMDWVQSPEIDALINSALVTVHPEERFAKYGAAQEKLAELCVTIPICDVWEPHAYQTEYLYWPAADRASQGLSVVPIMSYYYYAREMKIFPDLR